MTHEHEEPALFDLPLSPPPAQTEDEATTHEQPAPRRSRSRAARPDSLPLFGEAEMAVLEPESPARDSRPLRHEYERVPPADEVSANYGGAESVARPVGLPRARQGVQSPEVATAPLSPRLRAGLGDLVVLVAVGSIAVVGARALGGSVTPAALPAYFGFLLAFSFLYCVVSLAFWGQTPGMAWSGLIARSDETEPLSFGQTARRWLGHWLTWILLGIPALLALTGRSLADRLSGSETYELEPRG